MLNGHLDDDMVLLLTTGELDSQLAERAEKHLEACAACRKKLEDTSSFRLHLKEALQRREASQQGDEAIFKNCLEQRRPLSLRWMAAAAGIAALVSWTIVPHRLQAKDVLDRALQAETQDSTSARLVRVRAGGASCSIGALPLARVSTACARLNDSLQSLPWDWQHPLSVKAFRGWRDHLPSKHDSVNQTNNAIVVSTVSGEGPIRSAELTLSALNYRATHTMLRLENLSSIEISEEEENSDLSGIASGYEADSAPKHENPGVPIEDPADAAEVSAWLVLGRLKLLDGWKATLSRNGENIQVIAALESGERDELLTALHSLHVDVSAVALAGSPESQTRKFTPSRESFTEVPALGRDWVRKTLPSDMNATAVTNDVLAVSQRMLGQASVRDLLRARKAALRNCACSTRLTALIREQEESLSASTAQLITLLQPLFAPAAGTPPLLSSAAAHQLDTTLMHVFASGPAGSRTLDEELARIEDLLRLHGRSQ
jgi:hypothetical protein